MAATREWDGSERRSVERAPRSTLEMHIQTALATILTLLCAWTGLSVIDLGKGQVKAEVKIDQLQKDNGTLQEQLIRLTTDRVSVSDLRRVEDRLERLERVERKVRP